MLGSLFLSLSAPYIKKILKETRYTRARLEMQDNKMQDIKIDELKQIKMRNRKRQGRVNIILNTINTIIKYNNFTLHSTLNVSPQYQSNNDDCTRC